MPERTILHAVFVWAGDDGATCYGFRGNTYDIPQGEIDRAEPHGAFTANVGDEPPNPGAISELEHATASHEEVLAWNASASAKEVLARAEAYPFEAEVLLAAETENRGDRARVTVTNGLEAVIANRAATGAQPPVENPVAQPGAPAALGEPPTGEGAHVGDGTVTGPDGTQH